MKRDLIGLSRTQLKAALADIGIEKRRVDTRASQIWHWIYHRGTTNFSDMLNITGRIRSLLDEHFVIGRPEIVDDQTSSDGTRKWLLHGGDGQEFEMVFIPDGDRGSLCISSQIGCTLNCSFCRTGTMPLVRNLGVGEIVGQVMLARDCLGQWPSSIDGNRLTNIVLMGMGEPLYNFDNVRQAIQIVMDPEGIQMSRRRITLSTSGVVPMIAKVGQEIGVGLAVSLHAVRKDVRDILVPLNRKYGIEELLQACAKYPGANNARRIIFEYVLIKGVNDSEQEARELVALLRRYRIPAKVNLIPFNPWSGCAYECSDDAQIDLFSSTIFKAGISAPVRKPRGRDIQAACGLLKSAAIRLSARDKRLSPLPRSH